MTSNVHSHHHDDHLRFLLDQRAARADLHGRFPSQSDYSASPSLYSHAHFSPQSADIDPSSTSFHYTVSSHLGAPSPPLRSPAFSAFSDRERLNFPEASSLDLDDDSIRSSYDDHDERSVRDTILSSDDVENDSPTEEGEVAAFGPKMRFHSRAPWETGEDDEADVSSTKTKKKGSSRKGDSKKPWVLKSKAAGIEHRPSLESTRSAKPKASLDAASTTSSTGGALLALAQASMSSTSLALNPSPQPSFRDKLSIPRLRSRTTSSAKVPSISEHSDRLSSPSRPSYSTSTSPVSHHRATSPADSVFSNESPYNSIRPVHSGPPSPHVMQMPSEYKHPYAHPYANPDLARVYPHTPPPQLPDDPSTTATRHSPINKSDSNATLTDSNTISSSSQSGFSVCTSASITPVTSMSSMQTKSEVSVALRHGSKGISPPILVNMTSIRSPTVGASMDGSLNGRERIPSGTPMSGLTTWSETSNGGGSSIRLISLEEAQAQARERSRSVTASATPVSSPMGPSRFAEETLPSPTSQSGHSWSSRLRTTSAGPKLRSFVSNSTADLHEISSPVDQFPSGGIPHKTVTRKKSGFMKIFANGKDRPPPVPSLSSQPLPSPTSSTSSGTRKTSSHRVPVPSITPSMLDQSHDSEEAELDSAINVKESLLSARRNAPGLSIVTRTTTPRSLTPVRGDIPRREKSSTPSSSGSSNHITPVSTLIPESAPPTVPDFVGLRLRPVSSAFSKGFSEQFVRHSADQMRPSLDVDNGTPTTSATVVSPISPIDHNGLSVNHVVGVVEPMDGPSSSPSDDQASIIQPLEEMFVKHRKTTQRDIWELEGQVRDLRAELEEMRARERQSEYCAACGRGYVGRPHHENLSDEVLVPVDELRKAGVKVGGIVNRPRAKTGVGVNSRFANSS